MVNYPFRPCFAFICFHDGHYQFLYEAQSTILKTNIKKKKSKDLFAS